MANVGCFLFSTFSYSRTNGTDRACRVTYELEMQPPSGPWSVRPSLLWRVDKSGQCGVMKLEEPLTTGRYYLTVQNTGSDCNVAVKLENERVSPFSAGYLRPGEVRGGRFEVRYDQSPQNLTIECLNGSSNGNCSVMARLFRV